MASFKVPYLVASFFGGTGVLIIVGVMLDTMKQIESHLMMRHYEGFMKSGHLRGTSMNIVLLGPPGAGKGTLANVIKEQTGVCHISTGDLLREEMKKGSQLGQTAKSYVESGGLVPDDLIVSMIEHKLVTDAAVESGYMLDGFPRTTGQAEALDEILAKIGKPIDAVIFMELGLEVIVQRLTGRRLCRSCGAIFHVVNMPSKKDGVCDQCGGELYQRPDDNEQTIKNRMEVYNTSTEPVVKYYQGQGKLKRYDAAQKTADLVAQILKTWMNPRHQIKIKSAPEIEILAQAGKILAEVVGQIPRSLKSGQTPPSWMRSLKRRSGTGASCPRLKDTGDFRPARASRLISRWCTGFPDRG